MAKRVVIKIGTSVLTGGTRRLNRAHMVEIVRQCAALHREGMDLVICTSGAIAAGRERLGLEEVPASLSGKQMLAAVGQSRLMEIWEQLFDIFDIHVGQMLITRADIEHRQRFLNARDTLHALLSHRIIPVINENDAVATAEIRVGDNDNLSAMCVLLAEADLLIMLTDQPGLFTADPRAHPDAELIPEVIEIDKRLHEVAGGSRTGLGTGGMKTKLQAADVARRAGADVVIAAGSTPDVVRRIAAGEQIGTTFRAIDTPLENRKRWIFGGSVASGQIGVDAGAVTALLQRGGSLLPAGIVHVVGDFERGDVVRIVDPDGKDLARGIARYDSVDIARIKGRQSDRIHTILGYAYGPVVVHRDDLILV
jgi:glutamate 5-kinase